MKMNCFKVLAMVGLVLDISGLAIMLMLADHTLFGIVTSCIGSIIFVLGITKWYGYNQC